jgi:hypothetical protein
VRTAPRALPSGLSSKNEKRMVFIELARVSEIPAPHKFDLDFPAILNFQLFMYFHLKITIFLLMSCKNAKTPKLTKTSGNNNAKGLTSVN